jgi:hypothetical protein
MFVVDSGLAPKSNVLPGDSDHAPVITPGVVGEPVVISTVVSGDAPMSNVLPGDSDHAPVITPGVVDEPVVISTAVSGDVPMSNVLPDVSDHAPVIVPGVVDEPVVISSVVSVPDIVTFAAEMFELDELIRISVQFGIEVLLVLMLSEPTAVSYHV